MRENDPGNAVDDRIEIRPGHQLALLLQQPQLHHRGLDPDVIGVRLGTFDSDPGIRPEYHQFVDYAAPWEPIPDDGLPRYPEGRPPR